jgi:hypothetical protein
MNGCQKCDLEALNRTVNGKHRRYDSSLALPGTPAVAHARDVILAGFEWFGSVGRLPASGCQVVARFARVLSGTISEQIALFPSWDINIKNHR